MTLLSIRHISGTRATQIDEVHLGAHRELILGRAPSAAVRFDPHEDRSVGRHHARISWTETNPISFEIADLKSRNGTYVNGKLITTPIELHAGDIVRLGAQGPEIEVRWQSPASATTTLRFLS
jgi:serine protease Do